ncbi:unnamed protein product [Caenorhabditis angaria]|uniref:Solute carrier family 23 member 1 n=1 Tax=Caenorhabditis angaria TaxID=860376 RepID=A0A9P1INS2_9PELO|nr:unnamed protein product [Caenorhabditis angaria]
MLVFEVNDVPSKLEILFFGAQQMLICLSSLLVIPYLVSTTVCAANNQIMELRVQLISATFVTSGIATILQTTLGLHLSILHGPSFAFLPALHSFHVANPCSPDVQWQDLMQLLIGCCLISSLVMPFLGITGLIGLFSKYIGPITIVPLMCLLTIGTVPDIEEKMSLHWISVVEVLILLIFVILLENFEVPIPVWSFEKKHFRIIHQKIFSQFPYLIGIGLAWIICVFLTMTDLEPQGGAARTDKNESLMILQNSPWIQIPLPGKFGMPRFEASLIAGFIASALAATIESVGDYNLCAKISEQSRPPKSSINRAFLIEGFGSFLAALMGVGCGVTTYAENIAIMSVTKVVSRVTMQMAGVLLIFAGIVTKLAALLSMIPDAIIGGLLACGVCMINGVTLSNLQAVDLRLSRNLTIIGSAVILGLVIPVHFEKHELNTGFRNFDDIFGTLLKIRMLVGGFIAFVLDNITGGATREQRGFPSSSENDSETTDGYNFPPKIHKVLLKFPKFPPIFPKK